MTYQAPECWGDQDEQEKLSLLPHRLHQSRSHHKQTANRIIKSHLQFLSDELLALFSH